jgi:hypothetical protein
MPPMLSFHESRHWDLTPLRRPLWWGALALLLANDNLLKGRGIAPGWATGKLSDFAFLIVAPVLLAALLPRALPLRRCFAIGSVVAVFAAADLSPAFSDGLVALAARFGLRWRLWPDPTDLLALVVLPWTIGLLDGERSSAPARVGWRERIALVAGAFACLATSSADGDLHGPFFLNRTSSAIDLRVTWLLKKVACVSTPAEVFETLNEEDLDDPRTWRVEPGQVAVLERSLSSATGAGACPRDVPAAFGPDSCVAAILEAEGTAVLMVATGRWSEAGAGGLFSCNSSGNPSRCQSQMDRDRDPGPDAISLASSGRFEAERGATERSASRVNFAPVDLGLLAEREPAANGCRALREQSLELLGQTSCANDSECEGVWPPALPDEQLGCELVVTREAAEQLRALAPLWQDACVSIQPVCGLLPLAACRGGRCEPLCPVRREPAVCSEPCSWPLTESRKAELCASGASCIGETGTLCRCEGDELVCRDDARADVRCTLPCRSGAADGPRAGAGGSP